MNKNKYQQGWRENNPQTTLQDLKESVEMLNDPFGGMLIEDQEYKWGERRDYESDR